MTPHFEPFSCHKCQSIRQVDARAVILLLDTEQKQVRWACFCHVCGNPSYGVFHVSAAIVNRLTDHGATVTVKGDDPGAGRLVGPDAPPPSTDDGATADEPEPESSADGRLTDADVEAFAKLLVEPGLLENVVDAMAEGGWANPLKPAVESEGIFRPGMRVIDPDGDRGTVFSYGGRLWVRYDDPEWAPLPVEMKSIITGEPMFRPVHD